MPHDGAFDDDPFEEYEPGEEPSAFDRFLMVFTSPREAFAGLTYAPNRGSIIAWGLLCGIVVIVLSMFIVTSMPESAELQRQRTAKQIEKLEQRYEEGKISKEQLDSTKEMMVKMGGGSGVLTYVFAVIGMPIVWLLGALVLWAVARVLESGSETNISFPVALSTFMIALMIPVASKVLYTVLALVTGNPMFTLGPGLFASDPTSVTGALASVFDIFMIWWIIATGIGISVIAGQASWVKAAVIWGVIIVVIIGGLSALGAIFN